jgi:hypothetical protein
MNAKYINLEALIVILPPHRDNDRSVRSPR